MKFPAERLQTFANLCFIILSIVVGTALVIRGHLFTPGRRQTSPISVGNASTLNIPGVDWGKNHRTLVLALQKGCHYCTESADFYRRLLNENARSRDVHLVAVLPQEVDEGREYLSQMGLQISDVRQSTLNSLHVIGTPALLLVDENGAVSATWQGELSSDDEDQVLKQLRNSQAEK